MTGTLPECIEFANLTFSQRFGSACLPPNASFASSRLILSPVSLLYAATASLKLEEEFKSSADNASEFEISVNIFTPPDTGFLCLNTPVTASPIEKTDLSSATALTLERTDSLTDAVLAPKILFLSSPVLANATVVFGSARVSWSAYFQSSHSSSQ